MTDGTQTATERFHAYVVEALNQAADPVKAREMQAYMKTCQPFYGVSAPVRKEIFREAKAAIPLSSQTDYDQTVRDLWKGTHREEQYLALDVAEGYKPFLNKASWSLYEKLVQSASHWDTLDWIATRLVGPLVLEDRSFEGKLVSWSCSPNLWVRRASLLVHLKHGTRTNRKLLSETILQLAGEKEFFIQKAIGWVLRNYGRFEPAWVRSFVRSQGHVLSPLSVREALKHL